MRSTFTFLLFVFVTLSSTAQVLPNSSFEDWHTVQGALEPDYWDISPEVIAVGGNPMVERSTDAHSGMYAAKIVTLHINILGNETSTRGVLTTYDGFPTNGQPDSVAVWLKYLPDGNHNYALRADFTAWNANQQTSEPVGLATYIGGETVNYTRVCFPVVYSSLTMPDTVIFTFYNDYVDEVFGPNTALWIDDVQLIYPQPVGINELSNGVVIYPNPADESLAIENPPYGILAVYNSVGVKIYETEANSTATISIPTELFSEGVYFLQFEEGKSQRFVVKH